MSEGIDEIVQGIKSMRIRGANLIARSAARGLKMIAETSRAKSIDELMRELDLNAQRLVSTRPTAVSLPNAIRYIMWRVKELSSRSDVEELRSITISVADSFIENAKRAVHKIGRIGARRIHDGSVLLTHCNSSAALSIIKTAWDQGKKIQVFVTESRPWYQGRLSAKTLADKGIPTTLIVDGAARFFMKNIDVVVVGADAIAANGAVVNKIGTSSIALAVHEARSLFYVAAETFKFSPETLVGEQITIEERDRSEVLPKEVDIEGVNVRNPAFDLTPPEYIDFIITERGVISPQSANNILRCSFGGPMGRIWLPG